MISDRLEGRVFKPRAVPMSELATTRLALDGLEAMRLADVEGLYQDEAAKMMGISRATFGRVLADAHGVVADALVNGKAIEIRGGSVSRVTTEDWPCPIHGGGRRRGRGCRCGGGRRRRRHEEDDNGNENAMQE
jgi:predicted DNA-binding protein (UPF0251 family)